MTLKTALRKGDWIRSTNKLGAVIEGQAMHDREAGAGASAYLNIQIPNPPDSEPHQLCINTNFWDVHLLKANTL